MENMEIFIIVFVWIIVYIIIVNLKIILLILVFSSVLKFLQCFLNKVQVNVFYFVKQVIMLIL